MSTSYILPPALQAITPPSMDLPETSVQRSTLFLASLLLTACASHQTPADKQAALLAQPLTPNSLMREGDVINFQVFAPREPNLPFWQTVQFSAACSKPQVTLVYSFMLRRSYSSNTAQYAPATALPARYHSSLMNNRDFTQACKRLPIPDWRQVAKGEGERWLLLDNSSLQKNGKQVQFWMAYDEPKTRLNPISNAPFTQIREQYTMDCAARNAKLLARYYLNSNNEVTDGKVEMFPEAKVIAAADEDQLKVFELVCSATTSIAGLPALKSRTKAPVAADALPDINPGVLKSIEQLHMPPPAKTLTYIELAGTGSNAEKSWPERTEYFLSTDPATQQLNIVHKSEYLNGRQINWRGLIRLSGREQATRSENTVVVNSLSFRGDWQHMPVGSQLSYTQRGSITSDLLGTMGDEPKTVDCTVDSEGPAKRLNPGLSGNAKALSCHRQQRPSTTPVPLEHYYYLVDYGFFYHASTDKKDFMSINMRVQSVK
ncbi:MULTISPECIES: surface-adhesin E family protein [unclassified Pseudomonas]|uniref:surface-adhesin E family protein n=1 Tax=unclassified Pseudomonas TaxID=196821 RepID=UPI001CB6CE5C|nr:MULTISPECIES: surface-adhesin E family protein [unclassified Pseudomonas]MDD2034514.1 hypothetical protein [Pseudomonas sp. 39167]WNZ80496.1 hypothetical protein QOM08_10525 [Pseudomonas sp. P105]